MKALFAASLVSTFQSKIVISTWNFADKAIDSGWENTEILDVVQFTAKYCQVNQCDGTVGYGGSPSETGEVFLDAMIMDGETLNVGSVVGLRRVKDAVGVARAVLEHTSHSMLAGESATNFAVQMGFTEERLETEHSDSLHGNWKSNNCQPNYWLDVSPDSKKSCGPYSPKNAESKSEESDSEKHLANLDLTGETNHDTIGVIGVENGHAVAACSTNGMNHKIAGRVPDSSIPGSGGWAENAVGACSATGDGDVMLRFSPSILCVERMKMGDSPNQAAEYAIRRINTYYPTFTGAVIAVRTRDELAGAACAGMKNFPYAVRTEKDEISELRYVDCVDDEVEPSGSHQVRFFGKRRLGN